MMLWLPNNKPILEYPIFRKRNKNSKFTLSKNIIYYIRILNDL